MIRNGVIYDKVIRNGVTYNTLIKNSVAYWGDHQPSIRPQTFSFGVGGHPTWGTQFGNPQFTYPDQIDVLKNVGAISYRADYRTDANGVVNNGAPDYNWGRLFGTSPSDIGRGGDPDTERRKQNFGIVQKCQAEGINFLSMIYPISRDNPDQTHWVDKFPLPVDAYNFGVIQGTGWATNYAVPYNLTHVEIGNEMELQGFTWLLNGTGPGTSAGHYYTDRLERCVQWVRGMEEGIKSVKPTMKTMVNCSGWLATYMIDAFFTAAPTIDILAWHWYDNQQNNLSQNGFPSDGKTPAASTFRNLAVYLADRYPTKPIWLTEFGYRFRENLEPFWDANNQQQVTEYTKMITDWEGHANVEMVMYHELVDQMSAGAFSTEKYHGLIGYPDYDNTGSTIPTYKLLANLLRY